MPDIREDEPEARKADRLVSGDGDGSALSADGRCAAGVDAARGSATGAATTAGPARAYEGHGAR